MSDMKSFTFDLTECYSPDDLHDLLKTKLPLPEHYGGNLDALYDVFTEPHEPWQLTFTGCKAASALIGAKYMRSFKKMCEDATGESPELEIVFED